MRRKIPAECKVIRIDNFSNKTGYLSFNKEKFRHIEPNHFLIIDIFDWSPMSYLKGKTIGISPFLKIELK